MLNSIWGHFDSLYLSSYGLELILRNFDPYDHNPLPLNRSLYTKETLVATYIYVQIQVYF